MEDRLKSIQNKLFEAWNKYTPKQRATMISVAAVVIITLVILGIVLSRPRTVGIITCESTKQAAEVKDVLTAEGITPIISADGLTFEVNKSDESTARLILGANSIPTDGYGIDTALGGGFSTTEADKEKKYKLYTEEDLAKVLESIDGVKSASVKLSIPNDDGTIISQELDTYASVMLTLNDELAEGAAANMAQFVKTAVGNKTTDSIVIMDSNGNLLFSGEDNSSIAGNASNQFAVKNQAETLVKKQVKDVMVGTSVYDDISVSPNLVINFDKINETERKYAAQDGREEGLLTHDELYENETTGGNSGVPGTDSNDNTTYVIEDNAYSSSTTTQSSNDRALDEKVTDTQYATGTVDYENSSVSIVAKNIIVYREDDLRSQGLLNDMTFDQYISQNDTPVKATVEQDFYTMVSTATGVPEANISIVAYDVPFFQAAESSQRTVSDYLMIGMIVLILALLGFVIFKSTRPVEVLETEPELSVETLLASTKESPLEDIDFNEKSEARKVIEKFVDENPAAVAQLLRNWLNEDWE